MRLDHTADRRASRDGGRAATLFADGFELPARFADLPRWNSTDLESEMNRWILLLATLGAVTCGTAAQAKDHVKHAKHSRAQVLPAAMFPPTECEAYVAFDRDMKLPGYIL